MSLYNYHGTFYTNCCYNFNFEITADSAEEANAKAQEYFMNEANHDSIVRDSEVVDEDSYLVRKANLKQSFLENAEITIAYRTADDDDENDEEIDVHMAICEI